MHIEKEIVCMIVLMLTFGRRFQTNSVVPDFPNTIHKIIGHHDSTIIMRFWQVSAKLSEVIVNNNLLE